MGNVDVFSTSVVLAIALAAVAMQWVFLWVATKDGGLFSETSHGDSAAFDNHFSDMTYRKAA